MAKEYVSTKMSKKAHRALKDAAHRIEQGNGRYGLLKLFDDLASKGPEALIKFVKSK